MQTEIIAKATGTTTTTAANVIDLNAPSVVRLDLDRSQVAAMDREGNDLVIRLTDGQTIRVNNFYGQQQGAVSDLVLREENGSQWLAHPSASGAGRFTALTNMDDLLAAAGGAEGGGSSFILPALLGVAGVGGVVAAVSGGGNDDRDQSPTPTPDTQAPARPTAIFTSTGSAISGTGEAGATVRVTDASGATIGTGVVGADGNFTVPINPPQANGQPVTVTQTDGAGNVSPGLSVTAPDITPPVAPTAAVDGQGTTVTGRGEPGATVTVRNAAGTVLGTATVDAQGNYTLTLTTPQANGGTLTVTQSDAAGNVSPAITVTAPDITPPVAPTATIDGQGTSITGTGEPGATVTVRNAAGTVLGTATVDAQGNYALTLTTPQANGGTLTVTQSDPAGNVSPATNVAAPDITPPTAPTASVDGQGTTVTGTGEPGATVTVRDAAGTVLGTATVDAQGNYTLTLATPQANGGTLTVTQSDAAGNVSPTITVDAPDITPPTAPSVAVSADGTAVTGTGEPGATVRIVDADGQPIGSTVVGADGQFSLPLAPGQSNGQTLSVTQTDPAGNISPATTVDTPDLVAPEAPVATISADGTTVSGTGEPGATLEIRDAAGTLLVSTVVGADGTYSVALPTPQGNGEMLMVRQIDPAGNSSPGTETIAPDFTPPDAPQATLAGDGNSVYGNGEPGATVQIVDANGTVLGTAIVGADTSYVVPLASPQTNGGALTATQSDAAGNVSDPTTVAAPDVIPPDAPGVAISPDGTVVTGTGEPFATVTVRAPDGTPVASVTVGLDGSFTAPLTPAQANGETLSVDQTDRGGNVSPSVPLTAPDITAPAAPEVAINGDGTIVTGTGEPGATVTVRDAAGTPIGTALVDANGAYSATLTVPQANGETLSVTQADGAGNVSPAVSLAAPDITPPLAPSGSVIDNGATLSGTGEAGATVTVRAADGTLLGSAVVAADGRFAVPLATPQANGESLQIVQSDAAGNASPVVTVVAPDITAPTGLTVAISGDGIVVTGTGEPGATVVIRDPSGAQIGTALVDADGNYVTALTTPQVDGQTLSVTQADAAGNVSAPATLLAPDTTAPLAPAGQVTDGGATVTGTGEAGATVTVRATDGTVLGSGTVAADGSFTIPLTTPQANGQTLQLSQSDPAGNVSPVTTITAPDTTLPIGLTATVSADGALVIGSGEAGATVTIRDPAGTIIGTATVAADGSYVATLTPAQRNGETLQAVQADAAGNASAPVNPIAPDLTAPAVPTGTLSGDGLTLTGTGEAGATLTVRATDGTVLGQVTVGADGGYSVTLTTPQTNGQLLNVAQADAAGNVSPVLQVTALDTTAPTGLTATVNAIGTIVSGQAEAGATVTVRDPAGTIIGTATAAANGAYAMVLTTPQANGQTVQVVQADAAGNASTPTPALAPDITPPAAPVLSVDADGTIARGTGEVGATIVIRDAGGTALGTTVIGADGSFAVPLNPIQANGGTVSATLTDAAGNASTPTTAPAPDITPPAAPGATLDTSGSIVTGSGEVGATVTVRDAGGNVLGTAIVNAQGNYAVLLAAPQLDRQVLSVTQADGPGNVSPRTTVTAPDLTPPAAPVATVSADGTSLSGTGEIGATVTITDPVGLVLARVPVGADGSFSLTLNPALTNGQLLTLTQADAAGNVSAPGGAAAPDLVPNDTPGAPSATVSADGASVTGAGQAGAAILVRDVTGNVIGSTIVNPDGSYSATLGTPLLNGETVRVTQTDAEGDVSPPATVFAPDVTPPAVPTAAIDATGLVVTGIGEAGATVRVADAGGATLGTATVRGDGSYTVVLTTAQVDGQALAVTQADGAGNTSGPATVVAPDLTAPLAPIGTVAADGLTLSGTGETGATVRVRDAGGNVIGTALVAADGSFTAPLLTPQTNGQTLSLTQSDVAGNVSPATLVLALDMTPPAIPTATLDASGTVVTGTGEAGATVTIRDATGTALGSAVVAANGSYSAVLTPPQINGQLLAVTQADAAGNPSAPATILAPDLIAPLAPAGTVSGDGTTITGTGEAGATVTIRGIGGVVLGTALVAADGSFTAPLAPAQANGQTLTLTQADPAGNVSPVTPVLAPDITAPIGLTAAINGAGTLVTGAGEAGATVTIRDVTGTTVGTAVVAANGTYSAVLTPPQLNGQLLAVTQADAAGNASAPASVLAPDLTAPLAPVGTVSGDGTSITGTGEAGATVTIRGVGGAVLGTAVVAADGSFTAPLAPAQANGQTLTLTQADPAGNVSPVTPVLAPDITAPIGLTAAINGAGTLVTGAGEAGATVTIRDTTGATLGTAVVAPDGSYAAILTAPQINGQLLSVTQADPTGNVSTPATVTAPDLIAPLAPVGTVSGDGTTISGTGEAGATVTIRGVGGAILGTALVAADGSFTAPLAPAQANGQTLTLTQADPAGNISPVAQAIAPDITAPIGLTAAINGAGTLVTGTGEVGATVTVRDATGTPIGTGLVAANGSYSVTLTTPQANGQLLSVTQADVAGNVSLPNTLLAPDITPPVTPIATINGIGTVVTGTGEAGSTVRVLDPLGQVVGTAVVAGDGSFTATLTTPQANGQQLTVNATDAAGNVSGTLPLAAPDITPPDAPVAAIDPTGTLVTGTGEPGAAVEVRGVGGAVLGTGTVSPGGLFAVTLTTPQVAGQTIAVDLRDTAGNVSPAVAIVAPFDISAFDNTATALVDLVPVQTNENLGTAGYTALVSLGLVNLNAQVLAIPNVQFTVDPGHTLAATFTYDATLSLGVASGYSVVIQRFNGTNWVAVNGGGSSSLLEISLNGGDLVATADLGPGQYRAFVTFDNTLGVGLLGSLNVTGVDSDFTDVAQVIPGTAVGNVITDPGPGGQIDVVSPQTTIESVTVGTVVTQVTADGTVVTGQWGTLVIDRDGSYVYTPNANATVVGKVDQFTYTLLDASDGERESATLSVTIGSPDVTGSPIAVNDTAVATATFANVVQTVAPTVDTSFATPTANIFNGTQTGQVTDSFTVAANSTSNVTLSATIAPGLALLPSYSITVTNQAGTVVGSASGVAVAGVGGLLGSGISVIMPNLAAGTYNYTVTSTNTLGAGYTTSVYVGETITYLDRFIQTGSTPVSGELLANDTLGSPFLAIRMLSGGQFVEVGDTPLRLDGAHGSLLIDEVGRYTYQPFSTLTYSTADPIDSFTYQLVQPDGQVATARLDVAVDYNNGVGPVFPAATITVLDTNDALHLNGDVVPLTLIAEDAPAPAVVEHADARLAFAMMEGQGGVEDVLGRYLDAQAATEPAADNPAAGAHADANLPVATDISAAPLPDDPLGYLTVSVDPEQERLGSFHVI